MRTQAMMVFLAIGITAVMAQAQKSQSSKPTQSQAKPPSEQFTQDPFDLAWERLPPNYRGNDFGKIHQLLLKRAQKLKKDEFETTVAWQARVKAEATKVQGNLEIGSVYAFQRDSSVKLEYDADRLIMNISGLGTGSPIVDLSSSGILRGIEQMKPLNGDMRRVAMLDVKDDLLVQSNNSIKTDHIEIKLAPAAARTLIENGGVKGLFIAKLRPENTSEPVFATFATRDERVYGTLEGADDLFAFKKIRTLYVDIIGLVLYNERSGEMLATTVPGPAVTNAAAGIEFVRISPGSFQMGCSIGDRECGSDENLAHQVTISKGFELGKYEVTQTQWEVVMGTNPSEFKGANLPVTHVWWDAVAAFLTRLNARNSGYRYRIPTEAEWEDAARAGTTGAHTGSVDAVAWYDRNSGRQTHPRAEAGERVGTVRHGRERL